MSQSSDNTRQGRALANDPFGANVRSEFLLEADYAHLNNGSYGAAPRVVLAAQRAWQDLLERETSRFMDREFRPGLHRAAEALAPVLKTDVEGIALVENATQAVNAVLRGLDFRPGDEILVNDQTYPAVVNAAAYVAGRSGAVLRSVTLPFPQPTPDGVLAAFAAGLGPRTRLAIIDHVTSPTALILPVAEMAAAARAAGALVLVDGAHAPGMVDLDLPGLGVDWYTGNCHKWLFAAKGCAFLWTAPERRTETHPLVISHGYGKGYAAEFEWVGTRDGSPHLCLPDALAFAERFGFERIRGHNHDLVNRAADLLVRRWGTERGAGPEMTGSMATIRLPAGFEPTLAAAQALRNRLIDEHRVQVPIRPLAGSLWCRISAQIYNEVEDYERLAEAIEAMARP